MVLPKAPVQFVVKAVTPEFDLKIAVDGIPTKDDPSTVQGPAMIAVMSRKSGAVVQTIHMNQILMVADQLNYRYSPGKKSPSNYDDDYSLVADDFNFDGHQDLAICNGQNSGYGLPSYNVFLFEKGRLVENAALDKLAQEHLGMFSVDHKHKTLVVSDKSGAAWHETTIYKMRDNRPTLIERITEDANEKTTLVTDKKLVGGRWVVKTKRVPTKF